MADKTRGAKPAISYASLHNLCNIHTQIHKRRMGKGKFFEAERLIVRRNGQQATREYLVKWIGYPTVESTWEPEDNLNETLLRSYDYPQPDESKVDECCLSFQSGILHGLKSSGVDTHIYVPFQLDVWRFLSRGKGRAANERGAILLEKNDFERFTSLPTHWYYFLNQHGEGFAIDFPVRVRPYLSKSGSKDFVVGDDGTLKKAPILYCEKLSVYFVKRACNINNI